MRATNMTAAKHTPGRLPTVRHVTCGTEVTPGRVKNEKGENEFTIWCDHCERVLTLDELDPPGAICLVFD